MDDKLLLKAAFLVFQKLSLLNKNISIELLQRLTKLAEHFRDMSLDARRLALALNRNWLFAAKRCQDNIISVLDEIPYKISAIKQLTDNNANEETAVIVTQIYQELKQIQQEFAGLSYNKEKKIIAVITKPITLEDIYLGPFQIELHINKLTKLYNECPYYCVALEPNPAVNNEEVTHPHVSGERLCEGEGSAPIRAALEQGRLYDFFSVINSILNTYSPDSPYVSLDEWEGGASCYDCGINISNDDSYYCGFCDQVYCCECSSYCKSCDETTCLGCGGSCPDCEEFVCHNCLKKCVECGETFCQLCLEDDVCKNCKELIETEKLENTKNETDGKQDDFKMAG
ncbi:MAG: hypothetical protein A2Y10_16345 [Planctomycetes bacterium GWF2_41_51]|nr:MAG: hypothetical protein A2Y10_16345 [Planctomycetes bacterium GWF2_41_51]HBG26117.1 hypothetical protein [Phycisphaerales bacterium]